MLSPPFQPNSYSAATRAAPDAPVFGEDRYCGTEHVSEHGARTEPTRLRLSDMDMHLHCSVIGTCLGADELRKLMAPFITVDGATDLEVHHEAVRMASQHPATARALHRALDRRHEAVLQRFVQAKSVAALQALWEEALHTGDVPGAYWAVLTHRKTDDALRQRVFGEVHMLSHLMGTSTRANIRRLSALEQENGELKQRVGRQQERLGELTRERDDALAERTQAATEVAALRESAARQAPPLADDATRDELRALSAAIALQTERRERAETQTAAALEEQRRLADELDRLRLQAAELDRELGAAELQLRALDAEVAANDPLAQMLRGRRVLYVGGRPSSTPSIRALVERHGGEFQRHDGGIEDRKGLLASAVAWAQCVVFPVDCVDHDSALMLKRLCSRQGTPFKPLRSASVASFAAGMVDGAANVDASAGDRPAFCLKHG